MVSKKENIDILRKLRGLTSQQKIWVLFLFHRIDLKSAPPPDPQVRVTLGLSSDEYDFLEAHKGAEMLKNVVAMFARAYYLESARVKAQQGYSKLYPRDVITDETQYDITDIHFIQSIAYPLDKAVLQEKVNALIRGVLTEERQEKDQPRRLKAFSKDDIVTPKYMREHERLYEEIRRNGMLGRPLDKIEKYLNKRKYKEPRKITCDGCGRVCHVFKAVYIVSGGDFSKEKKATHCYRPGCKVTLSRRNRSKREEPRKT
jgi:hypothetical protein